jgi:sugar lactone lactonase YvrE
VKATCAILALLLAPAAQAATARIDYSRTIPSVCEFTKPRSFWVKLVNLVAGPPENRPEIVRPYATTHDSTGRLLIADPGVRGIHIFDFEKHKYQFVKGPKRRELVSPIGVACDRNDDIYVTDSVRAAVYVFDTRGKFLRTLGDSQLRRPTGLALDMKSRRLYLTDTLRHQVLILGLDGSLIRAIGRRGTGPGEFNFPTALTLSGSNLHVVDSMNFRIQTLTAEGAYLSSFGRIGTQTGTLNRPKGIAADADGNLYVADALFETVQVFSPQGALLYYFGASGSQSGQLQLPSGIEIDDRNVIYVADSLNHRVQVFRYRKGAD